MILPKIWKYHPEPITKYEKVVTIAGFIFLGAYPIFAELYGIWYFHSNSIKNFDLSLLGLVFIFIATIILCIFFYSVFLLLFCPRCINFSCFFNRVPKSIVDEYLKKNPLIRNAWEKHGYKS